MRDFVQLRDRTGGGGGVAVVARKGPNFNTARPFERLRCGKIVDGEKKNGRECVFWDVEGQNAPHVAAGPS